MDLENWDKIYLQLYAFTDYVLKAHTWFGGRKTDSYLEGRQPHDYVQDAIEYHLKNPTKFDPIKRTLPSYLKLHIIRRAIGNDSRKAENRKTSDSIKLQIGADGEESDMIEAFLPFTQALFEQEIDFEMIMNDIEQSIQMDPVCLQIFKGLGRENLKRREIIENYNMTETEYDNGMKRLKPPLRQAIKKYQIEEPKRVKKKQPDNEFI